MTYPELRPRGRKRAWFLVHIFLHETFFIKIKNKKGHYIRHIRYNVSGMISRYCATAAEEVRTPRVTFTPPSKPAPPSPGKRQPIQPPRSSSPPPQYDTRTTGSTPHRFTFHGNCNLCGQQGHEETRCPSRQALSSERIAKAAMATEDEAPYHTTFGKMYDSDEGGHSCAITIIQSSVRTGHNALTRPTEAIFDTGATGSIITNRDPLSDLVFVQSTTYRGLTVDMEVKEMGTLGGIGRVYYCPHAGMSIISASECANNGHSWEYRPLLRWKM